MDAFKPVAEGHSIVVDTRIAEAVFSSDEALVQRLVNDIDRRWLSPICDRHRNGLKLQLLLINEDGDMGELGNDVSAFVEPPAIKLIRRLRRFATGFSLGKG